VIALPYLILFFGVFGSGALVLAIPIPRNILKLMLAFTASLLFSIAVLDLIPEIYQGLGKNAGIYILIGFFFQIILEYFSHGIEHGHIHQHQGKTFMSLVMFSLCVHSLLEGMAASFHPTGSTDTINKGLYTGILLHHIPIAIALMTLLEEAGSKRLNKLLLLALFALMPAIGLLLGANSGDLLKLPDGQMLLNITTGIVTGIILHISTTILFESSEDHKFNFQKFFTVIIGALLALLLL
jgi:zinc and cadmium transporter